MCTAFDFADVVCNLYLDCRRLRGFDCGVYGADGDFGRDTESAMKRFQRARGLDADGVCGEKTWSALLGC